MSVAPPAASSRTATTVTGLTPRDPAKVPHAQRPAAMPSGAPGRRKLTKIRCRPHLIDGCLATGPAIAPW